MSAPLGQRRSARLAVQACGPPGAEPTSPKAADVDIPQLSRRKRQRRSEAAAPPPVAAAAAPQAAAAEEAEPATGPSRSYERELWQAGMARVAGVDEAGRGPLAGPVVAAACVIPEHVTIPGIDDSKKITTEERREAVYAELTSHPDVSHVVEADEIDRINILQARPSSHRPRACAWRRRVLQRRPLRAALKAMEGAVAGLDPPPAYVLVDGNRLPKALDPERARALVKGDSKCYAIAAASVIAKARLALRARAARRRGGVGGARRAGGSVRGARFVLRPLRQCGVGARSYPTEVHVAAIRTHGPCPHHRRTFRPLKDLFPPAAAPQAAAAGAEGGAPPGGPKRGRRRGQKAGGGD
eukprot:scaffold3.g6664.t1